ncbi:MAG TPA: hypothetical protein VHX12_07035, partial [Acidisoma sp.]|nr:hypothetical protein [Acidisoma sp.]
MPADAKRKDWVRRVLGVDPGAAPVSLDNRGQQPLAFEGPQEVAKSNRKKLEAEIKKFQAALEPLRKMAQETELASQIGTLTLRAGKLLPEIGAAIDVVRRARVEFDGMVVELNRIRNALEKWGPAPLAQAKIVLGAEGAGQSMTQALGNLADQAVLFARISVANPVSAISVHLADLGAKAQTSEQRCQIAEAADAAVKTAEKALEQKKAIEKRLYTLEVQINYLPEPVSQKNLREKLAAEREGVGT